MTDTENIEADFTSDGKLTDYGRERLREELARSCVGLGYGSWIEMTGIGLSARMVGKLLPFGYKASELKNKDGVRISHR